MKNCQLTILLSLALLVSTGAIAWEPQWDLNDWSQGKRWALMLEQDSIGLAYRKRHFKCQLRAQSTNNDFLRINRTVALSQPNMSNYDTSFRRFVAADCFEDAIDQRIAQRRAVLERFVYDNNYQSENKQLYPSDAEQKHLADIYESLIDRARSSANFAK